MTRSGPARTTSPRGVDQIVEVQLQEDGQPTVVSDDLKKELFVKKDSNTNAMKWWQEAVIYQIYPRSFQDSNGDGVGDLNGIISRLDYLNDGTPNSLGVDAIWLSPIYPSPMFDFGYDISDYSDIDPVFGDLGDFKRLLEQAHRRNIKIIMDLVINHTSHLHPWFLESRSSKDNPKRDWYIWQDAKYIGKVRQPPNNWLGMFGGKGWKWDDHTQQYYFHSFLAEQPDLNWRNPQVQAAVFDMVRGWLDLGVDGFRLDVINYVFKDDQLRNNPVQHLKLARPYDRQKHVYDRDRQPELSNMLREFRQLLDSYPGDRTSVGEIQVEDHTLVNRVASVVGGQEQLHMAFNFAYFFTHWDAQLFSKRIHEWDTACQQQEPQGGWPTYTLSNHDYERHLSRYTPLTGSKNAKEALAKARGKLAALMLLTLRGTPFLYYGEEIGMQEEAVARKHHKDPVALKYWPFHPGRDGCRRPMAWNGDYEEGGGFTTACASARSGSSKELQGEDKPEQPLTAKETKNKPWLPLSNNLKTINVKDQSNDPNSMLAFYKKCIWNRRNDEILRCGNQQMLTQTQTPKGIMAYVREYKSGKRLVLLNFLNKNVTVPLFQEGYFADAAGFQVVLSTHQERVVAADGSKNNGSEDPSIVQGSSVVLSANEGIVLKVWSKRQFTANQ